MAKAKLLNGADIMLFVGEGAAAKSIGCATNSALTLSTTMLDQSSPGHKDIGTSGSASASWDDATAQSHSWTASTENLFSYVAGGNGNSFDDLFKAYKQGTTLTAYFGYVQPHYGTDDTTYVSSGYYTPSNIATSGEFIPQYFGKCIVNTLNANAPYEGKATFTAEFQGKGELYSSSAWDDKTDWSV